MLFKYDGTGKRWLIATVFAVLQLPIATSVAAIESDELAFSILIDKEPTSEIYDFVDQEQLSADQTPLGVVVVNTEVIGIRLGMVPTVEDDDSAGKFMPATGALSLFGDQFTLIFGEPIIAKTTFDPNFDLRNYPAMLEGRDGYANFTFNTDLTRFVATIATDDGAYKLISEEKSGSFMEAAVFWSPSTKDGRSANVLHADKEISTNYTAAQLEAENARYNLISHLSPNKHLFFRTGQSVFFRLVGGDLGLWDLSAIEGASSDDISRYLVELSAISGADGDELFSHINVRGSQAEGYTVYFSQVFRGVPIRAQNLIQVDAVTGKVRAVMASIYPVKFLENLGGGVMLDETEAKALAGQALEDTLESHELEKFALEDVRPDMWLVQDGKDSLVMEFSYRMPTGGTILIRSDGVVTFREDKKFAVANTLFRDTCRFVSSRTPELCPSAQSPHVYRENAPNTRQCLGGSNCNATHRLVFDVLREAIVEWAVGNGSNCCASAGGGDNRIGAVIDTDPNVFGPSYSSDNSVIYLPGNTSSDEEVIGHEFGHAAVSGINQPFFCDKWGCWI